MARLGELLVAAGLLTVEQVEQALRAQVMWGGRLGTNVIELGYLDLDTLSKALGRLHHLPPALARHFERADRELQQRLSPDVAEKLSCVPLLRVGRRQQIAFASVAPLQPRELAFVANELGVAPSELIASVAAELRIRYHLERVYKIPRGTRFLRARGATVPPFPRFEIVPVPPDTDPDLVLPTDSQEVPVVTGRDPTPPSIHTVGAPQEPVTAPIDLEGDPEARTARIDREGDPGARTVRIDREGAVEAPFESAVEAPREGEPEERTARIDRAATDREPARDDSVADPSALAVLDDEVRGDADREPVTDEPVGRDRRKYVRTITDVPTTESERVAVGRIAIRRVAIVTEPGVGTTMREATRAIRRSTDRDRVADLVVDTIDRFIPACEAAILFVVRGDLAIGWKGFNRNGAILPEIGMPLDQPGLLRHAIETGDCARAPASELGAIDQLLLASLGQPAADLAVAPISIGGQVMCLVALVAAPGGEIATAEAIATAAGAGFARLMRDASR